MHRVLSEVLEDLLRFARLHVAQPLQAIVLSAVKFVRGIADHGVLLFPMGIQFSAPNGQLAVLALPGFVDLAQILHSQLVVDLSAALLLVLGILLHHVENIALRGAASGVVDAA